MRFADQTDAERRVLGQDVLDHEYGRVDLNFERGVRVGGVKCGQRLIEIGKHDVAGRLDTNMSFQLRVGVGQQMLQAADGAADFTAFTQQCMTLSREFEASAATLYQACIELGFEPFERIDRKSTRLNSSPVS